MVQFLCDCLSNTGIYVKTITKTVSTTLATVLRRMHVPSALMNDVLGRFVGWCVVCERERGRVSFICSAFSRSLFLFPPRIALTLGSCILADVCVSVCMRGFFLSSNFCWLVFSFHWLLLFRHNCVFFFFFFSFFSALTLLSFSAKGFQSIQMPIILSRNILRCLSISVLEYCGTVFWEARCHPFSTGTNESVFFCYCCYSVLFLCSALLFVRNQYRRETNRILILAIAVDGCFLHTFGQF